MLYLTSNMTSQKICILGCISHLLCYLFGLLLCCSAVLGAERLRIATTTSTDHSGLLDVLHPPFEQTYQIQLDVIVVGSGKALRLGENGDVDILMVHAPEAEQRFMTQGFGLERLPLMHNDFVIVGPANDPAGLRQAVTLNDALARLQESRVLFISRGDDSGTHKKELSLWRSAGIKPQGEWYWRVGQGMGMVLQMGHDKLAYTLSDRGTYLTYRDHIDLQIVFSGDSLLYNPYHLIIIDPERHPRINLTAARKYVDYLRGPRGQQLIKTFRKAGETLFFPDVITE